MAKEPAVMIFYAPTLPTQPIISSETKNKLSRLSASQVVEQDGYRFRLGHPSQVPSGRRKIYRLDHLTSAKIILIESASS